VVIQVLEKNAVWMFYTVSFLCCMFVGVAQGAPDRLREGLFSRGEYALFFLLICLAAYTKRKRFYLLTKPLPMLFLIYKALDVDSGYILAGLVLGVLGDVMLVFYSRWRPALTVGAWFFLFGHLSYLWVYAQLPLSMGKELLVSWLGLFLIFMHEYYYFMLKNAPTLEFVFGQMYWTVISLMLLAAANAQHYMGYLEGGFPFAFVGAFLFVLSDLCIHWRVYVQPDLYLVDQLILPLYYVAQLFILSSAPQLAAQTVA